MTSPELQFALDAVRQAAELARTVQREMISPALTKDDRSPVTVGDFASQGLVARLLADTFPDDRLVGEESSAPLRDPSSGDRLAQVTEFVRRLRPDATPEAVCDWIDLGEAEPGGRFWTLDPIDGTKGFLRGEQYAVALALVEGGEVRLGVLGCPNLSVDGEADIGGTGGLFYATREGGAWATSLAAGGEATPLAVSNRTAAAEARLLRSVEAGHTHGGQIEELVTGLQIAASPVRMDSQAKYAVLAGGGGDALVRLLSPSRPDYREKIWDQAAGSVVVEEAGGRVTDLDGRPLDFSAGRTLAHNRGVVASNGHLHEPLLSALAAIGA